MLTEKEAADLQARKKQRAVGIPPALIFSWDCSSEPYGIKDLNSNFLYANVAYKKLLGLSEFFSIEGLSEADFHGGFSVFSSEIQQHERLVEENRSCISSLVIFQENKEKVVKIFDKMPFFDDAGKLVGTSCQGREANHLSLDFNFTPMKTGTPGKLFTSREWDIVFLLNQGKKQKDIANRLGISFKTVRNKVYEILQKVSAKNTEDLIKICQSNGWNNYVPETFLTCRYVILKNF